MNDYPKTKKQWAQYCHEYLLNNLHEDDEEDWSAARLLKDIYDCHTCVYHIAQVYVKGIIPVVNEETLEFGGDAIVSKEEAEQYVYRLNHRESRIVPKKIVLPQIMKITYEEMQKLSDPLVIDVRKEENFTQIYQNPRGTCSDLEKNIVLVCTLGYQSTLAADLLIKAGYMNIFILAESACN